MSATRVGVPAAQLFARGGNAAYAAFRPTYPRSVLASIAAELPSTPVPLAVDAACGTGQLTAALGSMAQRVLAFDISPGQIAAAPALERTEFAVADATALPVEDHSVDLLTLAQAMASNSLCY